MLFNLVNLLVFVTYCLAVGFCYLIAEPSLLAQVSGGELWFLGVNTASGPVPGSEILFLLLVGLLLAFGLQIFTQVVRRQWELSLIRRALCLILGLSLWAVIGYQHWLRQTAGEQQIAWIQAHLEALPAQATPAQLEQSLAAFFDAQSRLSVKTLLPIAGQSQSRLQVNQDLAGNTFYVILTQFKSQHLQHWQLQQSHLVDGQQSCQILAEAPVAGALPRACL